MHDTTALAVYNTKYKEKKYFCRNKVLTEGVFETQVSGNAGTSV